MHVFIGPDKYSVQWMINIEEIRHTSDTQYAVTVYGSNGVKFTITATEHTVIERVHRKTNAHDSSFIVKLSNNRIMAGLIIAERRETKDLPAEISERAHMLYSAKAYVYHRDVLEKLTMGLQYGAHNSMHGVLYSTAVPFRTSMEIAPRNHYVYRKRLYVHGISCLALMCVNPLSRSNLRIVTATDVGHCGVMLGYADINVERSVEYSITSSPTDGLIDCNADSHVQWFSTPVERSTEKVHIGINVIIHGGRLHYGRLYYINVHKRYLKHIDANKLRSIPVRDDIPASQHMYDTLIVADYKQDDYKIAKPMFYIINTACDVCVTRALNKEIANIIEDYMWHCTLRELYDYFNDNCADFKEHEIMTHITRLIDERGANFEVMCTIELGMLDLSGTVEEAGEFEQVLPQISMC